MKKFISAILIVIALFLFSLSIIISFLAVDAKRNNRLLYLFDYSFSMIPTGSMEGNLEDSLFPGDIAIIKNVPYEDLSFGDVIVFQDLDPIGQVERLIIHRIVGDHPDGGYETKGDNRGSPDEENVTEENYLGRFTGTKISFIRPIVMFLTTSRHIVFLGIAIILVIILFFEILHIFKTINEEKMKKIKENQEKELQELELQKQLLYDQVLNEELSKKEQKK